MRGLSTSIILIILLPALLLAGCSAAESSPQDRRASSSGVATASPGDTAGTELGLALTAAPSQASPSPTPAPSDTPSPAPTQAPPSPTPAPSETAIAEPRAAASATPTATATATATATPARKTGASLPGAAGGKGGVVVYLIAENSGGPICGDTAVPAPAGVPRTKDTRADIEAALDVLFGLRAKYVGGLYNPLSYSTLRVQEVEFDEASGELVVWISGKYRPTGDPCDNTRVKAQIWNTAKQFGVSKTAFYLNGQHPLGDLLSNN